MYFEAISFRYGNTYRNKSKQNGRATPSKHKKDKFKVRKEHLVQKKKNEYVLSVNQRPVMKESRNVPESCGFGLLDVKRSPLLKTLGWGKTTAQEQRVSCSEQTKAESILSRTPSLPFAFFATA